MIPDDPIIRSMERTGFPPGHDDSVPICPMCGQECGTIYKTSDGEIVGCDVCLTEHDAWDVEDCFPQRWRE